jgi:hypothetical protein
MEPPRIGMILVAVEIFVPIREITTTVDKEIAAQTTIKRRRPDVKTRTIARGMLSDTPVQETTGILWPAVMRPSVHARGTRESTVIVTKIVVGADMIRIRNQKATIDTHLVVDLTAVTSTLRARRIPKPALKSTMARTTRTTLVIFAIKKVQENGYTAVVMIRKRTCPALSTRPHQNWSIATDTIATEIAVAPRTTDGEANSIVDNTSSETTTRKIENRGVIIN